MKNVNLKHFFTKILLISLVSILSCSAAPVIIFNNAEHVFDRHVILNKKNDNVFEVTLIALYLQKLHYIPEIIMSVENTPSEKIPEVLKEYLQQALRNFDVTRDITFLSPFLADQNNPLFTPYMSIIFLQYYASIVADIVEKNKATLQAEKAYYKADDGYVSAIVTPAYGIPYVASALGLSNLMIVYHPKKHKLITMYPVKESAHATLNNGAISDFNFKMHAVTRILNDRLIELDKKVYSEVRYTTSEVKDFYQKYCTKRGIKYGRGSLVNVNDLVDAIANHRTSGFSARIKKARGI